MNSPTEIKAALIDALKGSFEVFLQRGFSLREAEAFMSPTLVKVVVAGQSVAFVFSYDIRDSVMNCYVAQVSGGHVSKMGSGYFMPITAYLRSRSIPPRNPLSHMPRPNSTLERIAYDTEVYAALAKLDNSLIEDRFPFGA